MHSKLQKVYCRCTMMHTRLRRAHCRPSIMKTMTTRAMQKWTPCSKDHTKMKGGVPEIYKKLGNMNHKQTILPETHCRWRIWKRDDNDALRTIPNMWHYQHRVNKVTRGPWKKKKLQKSTLILSCAHSSKKQIKKISIPEAHCRWDIMHSQNHTLASRSIRC